MSRSYKKPYLKVGRPIFKIIHARRMRRRTRTILRGYVVSYINQYGEMDEPMIPLPKEITNPYDIWDQRCYWPEEPASYRK